eukprot:6681449-Pyramimonas_sp.AAC.1
MVAVVENRPITVPARRARRSSPAPRMGRACPPGCDGRRRNGGGVFGAPGGTAYTCGARGAPQRAASRFRD